MTRVVIVGDSFVKRMNISSFEDESFTTVLLGISGYTARKMVEDDILTPDILDLNPYIVVILG